MIKKLLICTCISTYTLSKSTSANNINNKYNNRYICI